MTTKTITVPVTTPTITKPVTGTLPIPASGTYPVVCGDTLIAIARRVGITPWWKLGEMNGLTEPYKIEVGQVLKLK